VSSTILNKHKNEGIKKLKIIKCQFILSKFKKIKLNGIKILIIEYFKDSWINWQKGRSSQ
jgi:hypothetical protein